MASRPVFRTPHKSPSQVTSRPPLFRMPKRNAANRDAFGAAANDGALPTRPYGSVLEHESSYMINGSPVQLRELYVRIRRLTPEEIMLHTRKSSRKRKHEPTKVSSGRKGSNVSHLQKRFRRIWVVSDNSDEEDCSQEASKEGSDIPTVSSGKLKCDMGELTQVDRKGSTEVRQRVSKHGACALCDSHAVSSVSEAAGGKRHVKKQVVKGDEVKKNLCKPDEKIRIPNKVNKNPSGKKLKIIASESEGLDQVSGESDRKITQVTSNVKVSQSISPSANHSLTHSKSMCNKIGNHLKRRTSSDKDNVKPRLISLEEDDQSNKICQKLGNNCKDPLSIITSEQPNSIKCLEKQKKELVSGSNELCDRKMTHFGQDSNSKDDSIAKEKCDDLTNVVLETAITHLPIEKEGSEKMLSHNQDSISKISHPPKSMEEVQEEGSTMNHDEYDSNRKSIEKNVKSSDKCIASKICEKSSLVASIINCSVLKESQPTQFAEKPAKDKTNDGDHLKQKNLKKNLKNKDNHYSKDKQLDSPFRLVENRSSSSETEGPKEVLLSKHDIASKELNATKPSKKRHRLPSVSEKEETKEVLLSKHDIASKELSAPRPSKKGQGLPSVTSDGDGLKRKLNPQEVKSKDDHHINADKSKQSANTVRPAEDTMNLNGGSEILAKNPDNVLKVSPCIKSAFRSSKLPSTSNDRDLKKKFDGKTVNCKDTHLDGEKCKQLNSSVKALENTPISVEKGCAMEMLRNHDSIPEKTHLAKSTEKVPGRSTEKVPGEVLISGDDQDLKEKCAGKNNKYTNVSITGGIYKHFSSPARMVGNTLPSCEKVSFGETLSSNLGRGSKESIPMKPVEKPDKEVCNNREHYSKPKCLKKTIKNENTHIGDEKRKQLGKPVKLVRNTLPLVERTVRPKEMLSNNQESFSKASQCAKSVEKASRNLISPASSEGDLKEKRITLNSKIKDDFYKSVEKSKQSVSSVRSVENMLDVDIDSTDCCMEPKDTSKHVQPNVEKLRQVSKMHDIPKITSSQAKFQQDIVSTTRPESDCKETFKLHKQKSKNVPVTCEDTQQLSKIEKGSRRVSKTMTRLSSEAEVSTTKQDEVISKESSAVPNVKKSFIGINTKSQQILASTKELEKTTATSENDVILVASSVIEKTGGSCFSSNHNSSSAIEADNIDQLITKYEVLMNHVKVKAIREKKSDKRLSQRKILNIFGEEHLAEDSESILNTPVFNIHDNGIGEFSKSNGCDGPLEKRENSGCAVTSQLNVETVLRKIKNNVEAVGKKRKPRDSIIIKGRKKSRRHSIDVASQTIKTGKKSLIRERASFDCLDSNIDDSSNSNFTVISTTCNEILLGNEQSKVNDSATLKRCISHNPETLHLSSSQGSSEERCDEAMRKKTGVDGLQATKHSLPSLLSKVTNLKEEVSLYQNENSIDEDPDIVVIDADNSVKKEIGTHMDEEAVVTNCSALDRILVSSPVSSLNPEYSQVTLSQNSMEISSEDQCVSWERLEEDDLLSGDNKSWTEFEIQQKLQQLEDDYKRKEKEIHKVKAMKEKVFRVWEKFCGIELVEKEAVKVEVNAEDNLSSPQKPEVTIYDVKEDIDEGSSVSTEILEMSDDFQIQQQQVELGSSDNAEIVSSSGTSTDGSSCSQESLINGVSAGGKELDMVSSSAIENQSSMPSKMNHNVQLATGGNCDDISGIHQFNSQEPQLLSVGMSGVAKAMISGPERADAPSEMRNVGPESSDNVPERRGDRIRVRGLNDLLALPSSQQTHPQSNLVAAPSSGDDPDKDIRDSFVNENAINDFKKLKSMLADLAKAYLRMAAETNNSPNFQMRRAEFLQMVVEHAETICQYCIDLTLNFRYKDPPCFASFLYFQITFAMATHNPAFTLTKMKNLLKLIFYHVMGNRDSKESGTSVSPLFGKVLYQMGILTDKEASQYGFHRKSAIESNSNMVLSQNSVQSVVVSNAVLQNQSATVNSSRQPQPDCVPPPQDSCVNVCNMDDPLAQNSLNTMPRGIQGDIQERIEVSSTSETVSSIQPDVILGHALPQVQLPAGFRSTHAPNVSVQPNHQPSVPFVSTKTMPQTIQQNLPHLGVGESLNVKRSRVVDRPLIVNHCGVAGGQLNVNQSSALARQNSNPVQNLVTRTKNFQHNKSHRMPNDQFANQVHLAPCHSFLVNELQKKPANVPFDAQQTNTHGNQQSNTVSGQPSISGSNYAHPVSAQPSILGSDNSPTVSAQPSISGSNHKHPVNAQPSISGSNYTLPVSAQPSILGSNNSPTACAQPSISGSSYTHTSCAQSSISGSNYTHTVSAQPSISGSNHTHTVSAQPSISGSKYTHPVSAQPSISGSNHKHTVSVQPSISGSNYTHPVNAQPSVLGSNYTHTVSAQSSISGSNHTHPVSAQPSISGSNYTHTVSAQPSISGSNHKHTISAQPSIAGSNYTHPVSVQPSISGSNYTLPVSAQPSILGSNNSHTAYAQSSILGGNYTQQQGHFHQFLMVPNQNKLNTHPIQGNLQTHYLIPGTSVESLTQPVNVQAPAVQVTQCQRPPPAYQSPPAIANVNSCPSYQPYNQQGPGFLISQGQVQRREKNTLTNNVHGNRLLPPPHSAVHKRNIPGVQSTLGQAQDRGSAQSLLFNVGQSASVPNKRIEVTSQNRMPANHALRLNQLPQSHSFGSISINPMLNQAVTNHGGTQPHRNASNMSHTSSHTINYGPGNEVQQVNIQSSQAQSNGVRASIIQSLLQRSLESHENHNPALLPAVLPQLNSPGHSYQHVQTYTVQQCNSTSIGMSADGCSAGGLSTYSEQQAVAVRRQAMLPSVTSPVHTSSPCSMTEENDQDKKSTADGVSIQEILSNHSASQCTSFCKPSKNSSAASMKKHQMKGRGQGLGRPISNDSGYRSPSQGNESSRVCNVFIGLCSSCHQSALSTCSRCLRAYYCSVDCQTKDWVRHRVECRNPV